MSELAISLAYNRPADAVEITFSDATPINDNLATYAFRTSVSAHQLGGLIQTLLEMQHRIMAGQHIEQVQAAQGN